MIDILNPSSWSSLRAEPFKNGFSAYKKTVLTSQFCVIGAVVSIIHSLLDVVLANMEGLPYNFAFLCTFFLIYILNEKRHYKIAKWSLLCSMNIGIILYAYRMPEKSSLILFYFPIICGSIIGVGKRQQGTRFLAFIIPTLLLITSITFLSSPQFILFNYEAKAYATLNVTLTAFSLALVVKLMSDINFQAQLRLKEEKAKQKELNAELKKANEELDKFVYSTSHDLRAPLASLLGIIYLAEKDFKGHPVHEYLIQIKYTVNRLDEFIKDILDYSRNIKMKIGYEDINFYDMIEEIKSTMMHIRKIGEIEFETIVEHSVPVISDGPRLKTVLSNLISNSIKYHDKQKESWVKVIVSGDEEEFKITVADNGIGIHPSEHQKVFEMFHRSTETSEGSGLGLYIVKEVVNILKGKIELKSAPREGTEISITVPNITLNN